MILLSFDTEEFDLPLEHHVSFPLNDQIDLSKEGTGKILSLLSRYNIKATFFCTAVFALNASDTVNEIVKQGHEIASHGFCHSSYREGDLEKSKKVLEEITGQPVKGYRMAFMRKTDMHKIAEAGYLYDSSVNPTFIPGRYNNLNLSRTCFFADGIWEIPSSVSFLTRTPLFWLSMHNFPFPYYMYLCRQTLRHDGYLNLYFHPWEFSNRLNDEMLQIPGFIRRNSGEMLSLRLEELIRIFKGIGEPFATIGGYIDDKQVNASLSR